MIRLLFLWQGNIYRSPIAKFIMKNMVKKSGMEQKFQRESAATSTEESINQVYPPARHQLTGNGIVCSGKRACQLRNCDCENYDLLIGMGPSKLRNMYRICCRDFAEKMHLLMDFTDRPDEIADPWYTNNFDAHGWMEEGCRGLLTKLMKGR